MLIKCILQEIGFFVDQCIIVSIFQDFLIDVFPGMSLHSRELQAQSRLSEGSSGVQQLTQ